jgi:DNA replication protein DnaC
MRQMRLAGELPDKQSVDTLEAAIEQERIKSKLIASGTCYAGVSLLASETKQSKVINDLKLKRGMKHVLISGSVGCGKTFGAIAYAANQAKLYATAQGDKVDAVFIKASELAELTGIGEGKPKALADIRAKQWLIVDDLRLKGEGTVTAAFIRLFEDIVDKRTEGNKGLIVTTNATPAQIKETYGERTYDRLRGKALVIESSEQSMR